MDWMLLPLKRYADFQGRSQRQEYWMFFLGVMIVYAILFGLTAMLGGLGGSGSGLAILPMLILGLFALGIIVPALAVQVRRFHDQDKSGWFVLLNLIPYVGGLVVLVFMCLPGTSGPNRFGPDPLGGNANLAGTFS